MAKGLKLNSRMFWGPNITFVDITGEKLVGGPFWPPAHHILNRVNIEVSNLISILVLYVLHDSSFIST